MMRTGEHEYYSRFGEFLGFVSKRKKAGSLHGSSKIRSSIAFDPVSRTVAATISLGGKPELGAFDPQTHFFYQNLKDTSSLAAVDLSKRVVAMRWPSGSMRAAHRLGPR
ncbi:MAG: hypothetical protein WBQ86_16730 [Candidatus Binatus sp.]